MPKTIGDIELYMGPDRVGGKDNLLTRSAAKVVRNIAPYMAKPLAGM